MQDFDLKDLNISSITVFRHNNNPPCIIKGFLPCIDEMERSSFCSEASQQLIVSLLPPLSSKMQQSHPK